MRVHLGSDHAGFELKQHLLDWLDAQGHEVVDHGALAYDPDDDYPPFCLSAAAAVAEHGDSRASLGVVLGGSGNGEQMAANKVHGVRAALAWSEETAALAREHNDANVLSLGARMLAPDQAVRLVEVFLTTGFSGDSRHTRRIEMLRDYEQTGELPATPER
jgi:ribose 5-phosphate isomerase B